MLKQMGYHFADYIFKFIFSYENCRILIKISLKFVPRGPINNKSVLVQIMASRPFDTIPLFEPMMVIISYWTNEYVNIST